MIRFHARYFLLTCLFLIIEIVIALFVTDDLVRPYLGDVLVVVLLYCFVRAFFRIAVAQTLLLVIAFSILVEVSQYLNLISFLDLQGSTFARTVLGNSFSWGDIVMYFIGGGCVFISEHIGTGTTDQPNHFHSQ